MVHALARLKLAHSSRLQLAAYTRNIGKNTKQGASGVALSTVMSPSQSGVSLIATWDCTQIAGTFSHYSFNGVTLTSAAPTVTGAPATANTPVPASAGVTATLQGGPYIFQVTAKDSLGRILATQTLTHLTMNSYTRPAVNLMEGRVTGANHPQMPWLSAYTFNQVATVSNSTEMNAFTNTQSADLCMLASYGAPLWNALFYQKVPGTGVSDTKRCMLTSEFGTANPSILYGAVMNGNATTNSYRCEFRDLWVMPKPIVGQNSINMTYATDCMVSDCEITGTLQNQVPTWQKAFLQVGDRWTDASTGVGQFQPTGCYTNNATRVVFYGVDQIGCVGTVLNGPYDTVFLENCTCQMSGVDLISLDGKGPTNTLNRMSIVNCIYGRPGWGVAHPDFGQLQTSATAYGYQTNYTKMVWLAYRQLQLDGRGTAHGGPFMGTPIYGGMATFDTLTIAGGHWCYGIEAHGISLSDVQGVDFRGFALQRASIGTTGGVNSQANSANNVAQYPNGYGTGQFNITHSNDVYPAMPYSASTECYFSPLNLNPADARSTVNNPSVNAGDKLTITVPNRTPVTVTFPTAIASSSTSAASIAAVINSAIAGVPGSHLNASTFSNGTGINNLQIADFNGDPVAFSDVVAGTCSRLGYLQQQYGKGWSGIIQRGFSQGAYYNGTYTGTPQGVIQNHYGRGKQGGGTTPPDYAHPEYTDDMSGFLANPNLVSPATDWSSYSIGLTQNSRPKLWAASLRACEAQLITMMKPLPASQCTTVGGQFVTCDLGDGTWQHALTSAGKRNQFGNSTLGFGLPASAAAGSTVNATLSLVPVGGSPPFDPFNSGVLPQDTVSNIKVNGALVASVTIPAGTNTANFSFTMPSSNATISADNDVGLLNISQTVNAA